MKLHELQEQRGICVAAMRTLTDTAASESRDLTDAEQRSFEDNKAKVVGYDKQITRAKDVAEFERSAPAIVHSGNVGDGAYEDRARQFSITKAIVASIPRELGGGNVDVGLEREISAEVQRRSGRKFEGIPVPDQAFEVERRTLLAGSSAADLIPTQHASAQFIDVLRARLVTGRLGASILDGLVGNIEIPRATSDAPAEWLTAEDAAITGGDPTVDDVPLEPKTVAAMSSYSRRTLINAVPSIETMVRKSMAASIAAAIDIAAITGNGASGKPTGVINAGATLVNTGSELSWSEVLEFIANIDADNALENSLGWVTSPWIVKKLRSTPKVTSTDSVMIMQEPNNLAGYPLLSTSQMPGSAPPASPSDAVLAFGDWSQLLIGYWSGVDVLVNPFMDGYFQRGRVAIRAMRDVDIAVRHPEAFAYTNSLST